MIQNKRHLSQHQHQQHHLQNHHSAPGGEPAQIRGASKLLMQQQQQTNNRLKSNAADSSCSSDSSSSDLSLEREEQNFCQATNCNQLSTKSHHLQPSHQHQNQHSRAPLRTIKSNYEQQVQANSGNMNKIKRKAAVEERPLQHPTVNVRGAREPISKSKYNGESQLARETMTERRASSNNVSSSGASSASSSNKTRSQSNSNKSFSDDRATDETHGRQREPVFVDGQQTSWSSLDSLFWDHLDEVEAKWSTLKMNDDIWAKLIYFERNRRLAKAYVSAPVLTIDGSTQGLDGFRIGLSGIENEHRTLDSMACLRSIGRGIRLRIDSHGNIIMRRIQNNNDDCATTRQTAATQTPPEGQQSGNASSLGSVHVKSWFQASNQMEPMEQHHLRVDAGDCVISELMVGQALKLFDMHKFRQDLQQSSGQFKRGQLDLREPDWRKCVNLISFMKPSSGSPASSSASVASSASSCGSSSSSLNQADAFKQNAAKRTASNHQGQGNPLEDSCWLMIINIIAIDMLKNAQSIQQSSMARSLNLDPRLEMAPSKQARLQQQQHHFSSMDNANKSHPNGNQKRSLDLGTSQRHKSATISSSQQHRSSSTTGAGTQISELSEPTGAGGSSSSSSSGRCQSNLGPTHRRSRTGERGVVAAMAGRQALVPAASQRALSSMGRYSQQSHHQHHQHNHDHRASFGPLSKAASQQHLNQVEQLNCSANLINQARPFGSSKANQIQPNQTIYTTFNYNRFNRVSALQGPPSSYATSHRNHNLNRGHRKQKLISKLEADSPRAQVNPSRQVDLAAIRMGKYSLSSFELSAPSNCSKHRPLFNSGAILMNYDDESEPGEADELINGDGSNDADESGKTDDRLKREKEKKPLDSGLDQQQHEEKQPQNEPRKQKISRASLDSSGASTHSSHSARSTSSSGNCDDMNYFLPDRVATSSCFSLNSSQFSTSLAGAPSSDAKKNQLSPSSNTQTTLINNSNNINSNHNLSSSSNSNSNNSIKHQREHDELAEQVEKLQLEHSSQHVSTTSSSSALSSSSQVSFLNSETELKSDQTNRSSRSTTTKKEQTSGKSSRAESVSRGLRVKQIPLVNSRMIQHAKKQQVLSNVLGLGGSSSSDTSLDMIAVESQLDAGFLTAKSRSSGAPLAPECSGCCCYVGQLHGQSNLDNGVFDKKLSRLNRNRKDLTNIKPLSISTTINDYSATVGCELCCLSSMNNTSCCDIRTDSSGISTSSINRNTTKTFDDHSPPAGTKFSNQFLSDPIYSVSPVANSKDDSGRHGLNYDRECEDGRDLIKESDYKMDDSKFEIGLRNDRKLTRMSPANVQADKLIRKRKYGNLISRFIQPFNITSSHQSQQKKIVLQRKESRYQEVTDRD